MLHVGSCVVGGISTIQTLFVHWRTLQRILEALPEDHATFESVIVVEDSLVSKICAETPAGRLDEDIQLFVLATNEMIDMAKSEYVRLASTLSVFAEVATGHALLTAAQSSRPWQQERGKFAEVRQS